jgi:hypothetical protein
MIESPFRVSGKGSFDLVRSIYGVISAGSVITPR